MNNYTNVVMKYLQRITILESNETFCLIKKRFFVYLSKNLSPDLCFINAISNSNYLVVVILLWASFLAITSLIKTTLHYPIKLTDKNWYSVLFNSTKKDA